MAMIKHGKINFKVEDGFSTLKELVEIMEKYKNVKNPLKKILTSLQTQKSKCQCF